MRANEAGDVRAIESKSQHLSAALEMIKSFRNDPLPDDSALYYGYESLLLWAHRTRYRPADLRLSIEDAWTKINDMAIRQEQMLAAVRDRNDLERLQQRFLRLGLVPDKLEKVRDKHDVQIAWKLDASKPA